MHVPLGAARARASLTMRPPCGTIKRMGSRRRFLIGRLVVVLALALPVGCEKASYYGSPAPQPPVPQPVESILLTAVEPPDGAVDVAEDVVIQARFSRAPDPATVTTQTFRLIDGETKVPVDGAVVPVEEVPGEPATLYRFLPEAPLKVPSHPYRIEVGSEIAAPDGTTLDLELSPILMPCCFVTRTAVDTVPPHFFANGGQHAVAVSPMAIKLTWWPAFDNAGGTPPGLIHYAIYMGPGAEHIDFLGPVAVTTPGATAYTVSGLMPNTEYAFVIHPIDAAGNEDDNTEVVSARTWLSTGTTELTLLYSSDVFGTLEPCG